MRRALVMQRELPGRERHGDGKPLIDALDLLPLGQHVVGGEGLDMLEVGLAMAAGHDAQATMRLAGLGECHPGGHLLMRG